MICLLAVPRLDALTLDDLLGDSAMTPKRFASFFEDFSDEFSPEVQTPDEFLSRRRGDCDDYATLADLVLHHKGYETRLIHVRMAGLIAHAVCYVTRERAYLDYNNRVYFFTLQHCGKTIREIASKVADSFDANWTSASEFTYADRHKSLVATVVKTDPPASDPIPGKSGPPVLKVDF